MVSVLLGTLGLTLAALVALVLTVVRGRVAEASVPRIRVVSIAAILLQVAHFIEETQHQFYVRFPELLGLAHQRICAVVSRHRFDGKRYRSPPIRICHRGLLSRLVDVAVRWHSRSGAVPHIVGRQQSGSRTGTAIVPLEATERGSSMFAMRSTRCRRTMTCSRRVKRVMPFTKSKVEDHAGMPDVRRH